MLKRRGFRFVMPEEGQMARPGEEDGIGRLADLESIFREVSHVVSAPQDLRGVRVLVTGGRTEESWDPVRVLTNRSTGRMGFALAEEARERGADVVLVHGPTDVIPPVGVRVRRVTTAAEMAGAVKQEFPQAKIILMAAAVADYTFAKTAEHKIKKGEPSPEIQLVATEDILKSLADRKDDRIVVGFALETENLLENSLKKLREKHLDIVVANNPLSAGSGFAVETNQVLLIHRTGRVTELPLQSKREAARDILNAVIEIYRNPEPEPEAEEELLLDEEEEVGGLDLSGLEIEEQIPDEKPVAASAAPASTAPPSQPQGERTGRKHRKHRGGKQRGQQQQQGQQAHASPESTGAPAPEPAHAPASEPSPVPVETHNVEHHPVARFEVDEETVSDLPGSIHETPAELPFPNVGASSGGGNGPGNKKPRGRRGGRRAQRARAKREAAHAGGGPLEEHVTVIEPHAAEKVPAPHPAPHSEPAVNVSVVSDAVPADADDKPAKAKKPRAPRRSGGTRPKKTASRTKAAAAQESPAESGEIPAE